MTPIIYFESPSDSWKTFYIIEYISLLDELNIKFMNFDARLMKIFFYIHKLFGTEDRDLEVGD